MVYFTIAIAFLMFGCNAAKVQKDTVLLTVIYDSYSRYSVQFLQQLYQSWKEFKNNLRLELIPFGLTEVSMEDGHYEFTCPRGPRECEANVLHACAIDEACRDDDGAVPTIDCPPRLLVKALTYIDCLVKRDHQTPANLECALSAELSPSVIESCAEGDTGELLLSKYGSYTKALKTPSVTFVPYIMVNYNYTDKNQIKAQKDLRGLICDFIPRHWHCEDKRLTEYALL